MGETPLTEFAFISALCESHLIPSRNSVKQWTVSKLSELCYLYFLALIVLLFNQKTRKWARTYCENVGDKNDFKSWRSSDNDLYAMLYSMTGDDTGIKGSTEHLHISSTIIRKWLRDIASHEDIKGDTHYFMVRIDGMFDISKSSLKSLRRTITDWDDADKRSRQQTVSKLSQEIRQRSANCEVLSELKKLSDELDESASSGATGAASVATVVSGLGTGFDASKDHGVYSKKKPVMIRRAAAKDQE